MRQQKLESSAPVQLPLETLMREVSKHRIKNSDIQTVEVDFTPELADKLLGANLGNRPMKTRVLETYMRDMTAGDWKMTGETIVLDKKGELLNGQHRLNACVKSGQSFRGILVSGVDRSAFKVMDSGEKRRASDALALMQEKNAKTLQGTLALLWTYDQGQLASMKRYPSNSEIEHTLEQHRRLVDLDHGFMSSTFTKSVKGIAGSAVAALCYLFSTYDERLAREFFERLGKGTGLTETNPIYKLRESLFGFRKRGGISRWECCALIIKTWNAYITGEPLSVLRVRNVGKNREEMPKIMGVQVPYEAKVKKLG